MLTIDIPGSNKLELEHVILDYNGTIAEDGMVIPGVKERVGRVAQTMKIHVITADTFGSVRRELKDWNVSIHIITPGDQEQQKRDFCRSLKPETVAAMGNGRNDRALLKEAALGIAIVNKEGACTNTLIESDIVTTSIIDALDLLLIPDRLRATLRN